MTTSDGSKMCAVCHESKPLSEFHRDSRKRDGLQRCCRRCNSAVAYEWQKKNRERYLQNHRKAAKGYMARNPEVRLAHERRMREIHPERYNARKSLRLAIAACRVVKPSTCESCHQPTESRRLHGHHEDYSKPLDVRWLCRRCHEALHAFRSAVA